MKTRLFLSIYYFVLLSMMIIDNSWFYEKNVDPDSLVWFANIFHFVPYSPWVKLINHLLLLGVLVRTIFKPGRFERIISSILLIFFLSLVNSQGSIGHHYHVWIISSIGLCFLNSEDSLGAKLNRISLRTIQNLLLSHYIAAAIWKLRHLEHLFSFSYYKSTILEHMAYTILEGSGPLPFIKSFLIYEYPSLMGIGFILAILFQLSCLVPMFFHRFYFHYGLMAVGFHLMTGIVLGIWFTHTVPCVFLFLVFYEGIFNRADT